MDKFGVFSLLNSFLKYFANGKGDSNPVSDESQSNDLAPSNANENSPTLSSLLSSFIGKKNDEKKSAPSTPIEPTQVNTPLQSGMLATMRSHDDFVKRVKLNANKKPTIGAR